MAALGSSSSSSRPLFCIPDTKARGGRGILATMPIQSVGFIFLYASLKQTHRIYIYAA